jgi:hypothetical protein
VQFLENDCYLGTPGSFDYDFTPLPNKVCKVFSKKHLCNTLVVWDYNYSFLLKLPHTLMFLANGV